MDDLLLPGCSCISKSKPGIYLLSPFRQIDALLVTKDGKILDKRQVQVNKAADEVSSDPDDVPGDGGLYPGVDKKVMQAVKASDTEKYEERTDDQGDDGYQFRHPDDGFSPIRVKQVKYP